MDEFSFFTRLPLEIQRIIWRMVARKSLKCVHTFTVIEGNDESELDPTLRSIEDRSAPNLQDAGLWLACKESRLAMIERYNHLMEKSKCSDDEGFCFSACIEGLPDTVVGVLTNMDLVILDISNINYYLNIPPLTFEDGRDLYFHNVAVEFQPEWLLIIENVNYETLFRSKDPLGLFLRLFLTCHNTDYGTRIWLIDRDYHLIEPDMAYDSRDRQIFPGGNSTKFVEVKDIEEIEAGYSDAQGGMAFVSAFSFMEELLAMIPDRILGHLYLVPRIRVLVVDNN